MGAPARPAQGLISLRLELQMELAPAPLAGWPAVPALGLPLAALANQGTI